MGTTLGSTGITFNDATVQTTAAVRGLLGIQVFTASGTFTVPSGITVVKVTVVGGGGGGAGLIGGGGCCATGVAGSTGGTSSFGAYCSATGGAGGTIGGTVSAGGIGSGGNLNLPGGQGGRSLSGDSFAGGSFFAPTRFVWKYSTASPYYSGMGVGLNYGGGGTYTTVNYSPGGGGGTAIKLITGLTPGGTVSVTVGAGGAGGGNSPAGYAGGPGIVIVEW